MKRLGIIFCIILITAQPAWASNCPSSTTPNRCTPKKKSGLNFDDAIIWGTMPIACCCATFIALATHMNNYKSLSKPDFDSTKALLNVQRSLFSINEEAPKLEKMD